ncbi:MAG: hypothetical protein KC458_10160, partial [Dehalococcoidia bacterium]|nr:hypothetical protein [Dehalococcoidia bacterium]
MRYQVAALLTGLVTVLALAGAATFVWLSVGAADDDRRQIAAESEIEAVQAALRSRIDGLQAYASALLQEQDITSFAVRGTDPPEVLDQGRISRGGADYILISGPGRVLVYEDGIGGSIVNGVEDVVP